MEKAVLAALAPRFLEGNRPGGAMLNGEETDDMS